jgi:hypothetical protein
MNSKNKLPKIGMKNKNFPRFYYDYKHHKAVHHGEILPIENASCIKRIEKLDPENWNNNAFVSSYIRNDIFEYSEIEKADVQIEKFIMYGNIPDRIVKLPSEEIARKRLSKITKGLSDELPFGMIVGSAITYTFDLSFSDVSDIDIVINIDEFNDYDENLFDELAKILKLEKSENGNYYYGRGLKVNIYQCDDLSKLLFPMMRGGFRDGKFIVTLPFISSILTKSVYEYCWHIYNDHPSLEIAKYASHGYHFYLPEKQYNKILDEKRCRYPAENYGAYNIDHQFICPSFDDDETYLSFEDGEFHLLCVHDILKSNVHQFELFKNYYFENGKYQFGFKCMENWRKISAKKLSLYDLKFLCDFENKKLQRCRFDWEKNELEHFDCFKTWTIE